MKQDRNRNLCVIFYLRILYFSRRIRLDFPEKEKQNISPRNPPIGWTAVTWGNLLWSKLGFRETERRDREKRGETERQTLEHSRVSRREDEKSVSFVRLPAISPRDITSSYTFFIFFQSRYRKKRIQSRADHETRRRRTRRNGTDLTSRRHNRESKPSLVEHHELSLASPQ